MATGHRIDGKKPKRKTRTAVAHPDKDRAETADHEGSSPAREAQPVSSVNEETGAATQIGGSQHGSQSAFDSFYLQQMTKEFATDLDKLRTASDFRPNSLPVLIEALKQGAACFNDRERLRVASDLPKE